MQAARAACWPAAPAAPARRPRRGSPAPARWRTRGPSAGRRSPPGRAHGRRAPCRARRAPAPSSRRRAASRRRPARSPPRAAARCARAAARRSARRGGAPARGSAASGPSRRSSGAAPRPRRRATRPAGSARAGGARRGAGRRRAGAADDATTIAADHTEAPCATMGACRAGSPRPPSSAAAPSSSCWTPRWIAPPRAGRRSRSSAASRASASRGCCGEFEARARARGARVLLGQCLELGGAQIPYAPLVAALRPLARGLAAEEAETLPVADPQRAGRAAARAGRDRDARRRGGERPPGPPVRGDARAARAARPHRRRCCWRSRTCTGPTARRATSSPSSCAARARSRSASSSPTAPTSCTGATRCARCSPSWSAPPASTGSRWTASTATRSPSSSPGSCRSRAPAELAERLFRRSQGNPLYTEELLAALEDGDELAAARDAARRADRPRRAADAVRAGRRAHRGRARPAGDARAARGGRRPGARRGDGGRARGGRPPGAGDRRAAACTRSATRSSARPCTATCCPARTPRCTPRSPAAIDARPELLGDVTDATVAAELACHWKSAHELSRSLGASVRAGLAAEARVRLRGRRPPVRARAGAVGPRARRGGARGHGPRRGAAPRRGLRRRARRGLARHRADPQGDRGDRRGGRAAARRRALPAAGPLHAPGRRRAARASPRSTARPSCCRRATSAERARVLEERARVEMLFGDFALALATRRGGDRRGAGGRRRADRGERADHARLHARRPRRRGGGDRDAARGARRARSRSGRRPTAARAAVNLSEALDLAGHTEEALAVVEAEVASRAHAARAHELRRVPRRSRSANLLVRLGRLDEARERLPRRVPGEAVSYTGIFWRDTRARSRCWPATCRRCARSWPRSPS